MTFKLQFSICHIWNRPNIYFTSTLRAAHDTILAGNKYVMNRLINHLLVSELYNWSVDIGNSTEKDTKKWYIEQ